MSGSRGHILLCGPDIDAVNALVHAAAGAQTTASEADWDLPDVGTATLSCKDERFGLDVVGLHPFWGKFLKVSYRSEFVIDIADTLPAKGSEHPVCVAIVLPAVPDEKGLSFLQSAAGVIADRKHGAVRRVIFVIPDALTLLDHAPPWIDALDEWDRICAGESRREPPLKVARTVATWHEVAARMDRAWGRRLGGLAADARKCGIEVATLPVSESGFDSRTAMVLRPGAEYRGSIAFNLRPLVHALAPDVPLSLPDLLSAGSP